MVPHKKHKPFELVRLNKAVVGGRFLYLLTLTIRDVEANAEKTIRATVNMPPPYRDPLVEECKLLQKPVPFEPLIDHISDICESNGSLEHKGSKRDLDRESREAKRIVNDFLSKVQQNQLDLDEIPDPPNRQCPAYIFIHRYVLEDLEDDPEIAEKFLHQVSDKLSYDVFCMPPRLCPFICHKGSQVELYVDFLKQTTDCVFGKINSEAKEMGKTFVLVSVDKVVGVGGRTFLLTLTIEVVAKTIVIAKQVIIASVSLSKEGPKLSSCSLISSILT